MKYLALTSALLISIDVYGKCWSATELSPTYCASIKIEQVLSKENCIVQAKLVNFSIPRADLQNLKWANTLKSETSLKLKIDSKKCPSLKIDDQLNGIVSRLCDDKDPPSGYSYAYSSEDTFKATVAGKDVKLNCRSQ